jgi:hypothetical protein
MVAVAGLGVGRAAKTCSAPCRRRLFVLRAWPQGFSRSCDQGMTGRSAAAVATDLLLKCGASLPSVLVLLGSAAPAASAVDYTYVDPALTAEAFAPQLNPAIAIAAAAAATPPIIFWGRILLANQRRLAEEQRRQAEEEQKKQKREVRSSRCPWSCGRPCRPRGQKLVEAVCLLSAP